MQDLQLYQQLLGRTAPWFIQKVTLNLSQKEVEVEIGCQDTLWGCPEWGHRMHIHSSEPRRWRHLDTCQCKTFLVAQVLPLECPDHGTQLVAVPWAEKYGRFTKLFERWAIDVMKECSTSGACELLGITWDEADGIKQRAVAPGLARKGSQAPRRVSVDEKSFGRGHPYATVVVSQAGGQPAVVEYVAEGRRQESLDAYWLSLTAEQRQAVEAVAMDLWDPFKASTCAHVPEAEKILHDPFHLVGYMNEAVNDVRKEEHRELLAAHDDRLTGTRFHWLHGLEHLPQKAWESLQQLSRSVLKTARAWRLKETFRWFWWLDGREQAQEYFPKWHRWATHSRLEPVQKVAHTFKRHLPQILNFFDHLITNGPLEGSNNLIQSLIKKAYGYRNFDRFRNDIFFHLGGLDLYPTQ